MQDKDAVIVLRKGQELIAFPGEGGYKIEWSPGTQVCPLTKAPSGHLVVQCDHFNDVVEGDANSTLSFITDHSNAKASTSD